MSTIAKIRIVLVAIALSATLPVETATARSIYDGIWSVSVVTDAGACNRGYRYRVRITNGQITYDESQGPGAEVYGRVRPNGQVSVLVRQGSQSATGSGRLRGNSGAGRWVGRSADERCVGRWQAERRYGLGYAP